MCLFSAPKVSVPPPPPPPPPPPKEVLPPPAPTAATVAPSTAVAAPSLASPASPQTKRKALRRDSARRRGVSGLKIKLDNVGSGSGVSGAY